MVIRNNNIAPGGDIHTYGFDTYKENLPPGTYNSITVGDQILHLPWKSVASGGSDRLFATPVGDTTITFAYQSGMPVNASSNQERYTLWTGSPPAGEDNLLALCSIDSTDNAAVAGGVRVKSYELTRHNVVVVPIGNNQPTFTEQELRNALNDIYAQAVIDWDVSILSPLAANYFEWLSGGVEVNTTDYSEDMREVWRTFVMLQNATPGTTYLFIIPGFKDHPGMTGYMPLKSGYGFLTPSATTRDAAHELAHGVFNLRHTFSQHNTFTLPEGTTANLMDYTGGTELWKYQWDFIHDPEGGWFIFEDSEEGAYDSPECRIALIDYSGNIRDANLDNEDNLSIHWSGDDFECLLFGIELGGTEFDFIGFKANFEEYNGNITFNPSEYKKKEISSFYNFNTSMTRYDFGYFQHEDDPWVMISYVVPQSQANAFEEYLFGGDVDVDFELQLFVDDEQVEEGTFLLISQTPEMPNISIAFEPINEINYNIRTNLNIEHFVNIGDKNRDDSDFFPNNNINSSIEEWHILEANETKEWQVNFNDYFAGGEATINWEAYTMEEGNENIIQEGNFTFYIRGENPDRIEIENYIDNLQNAGWYLLPIAIHESGGGYQFNRGANYGTEQRDHQGMPNYGGPDGWGLMQLEADARRAHTRNINTGENGERDHQLLWNWQDNIDGGAAFFESECRGYAERILNNQLELAELAVLSGDIDEIPEITMDILNTDAYDYGDVIFQDSRFHPNADYTFLDALAIKRYNGASRPGAGIGHFIYWDATENAWAAWELNNHNPPFNYVSRICREYSND